MSSSSSIRPSCEQDPRDWEPTLRESGHVRGEVLDSIDRDLLDYNGERFALCKVDREAVLLAHMLCARGGGLVLHYPVPKFHALSMMGLEALYAHPLREVRPYVLCVTHDSWHRGEFMSLRFKGISLPIHRMTFPVGMVRGDGGIRNLSGNDPLLQGRPTLVFSREARMPHALGERTAMLIAEVDSHLLPEDVSSLMAWASASSIPSAIYVVSDPFLPQAAALLKSGLPVWSWDQTALAEAAQCFPRKDGKPVNTPFSPPERWLKNASLPRDYLIVPVEDDNLQPKLADIRRHCKSLLDASERTCNPLLKEAARRAIGDLHALEDLPVPSSYYEKEAEGIYGTMTMRARISSLERIASVVEREDPHSAAYIEGIADRLTSACNAASESHSGKPVLILEYVKMARERRTPLVVVVRNTAAKNGLERFLSDRGYDLTELRTLGVDITTQKDLEPTGPTGPLLLTSVPRYNGISAVLYPEATRIGFLVYPEEIPVVEYILRRRVSEVMGLSNPEAQANTLYAISGAKRKEFKEFRDRIKRRPRPLPPRIQYAGSQEATVEGIEMEPLLDGILGSELLMPQMAEYEEPPAPPGEPDEVEETTKAIAVGFASGRTLLVKPSSYVTIYKEATDAVPDILASNLVRGSYVVLVNESITRSLLEVILDRVHRHPKMTMVVFYQRTWIETLRKGMDRCGDTTRKLLQKMKEQGSKVESPLTLHFWRKGTTIGPLDPEDIRRVGLVYGDDVLVNHAAEVEDAVRIMRRIHRQLARRLRFLIKRAGISWETLGDADLIVDEDLGLYLEDFADAVRVEEVTSISSPFMVESFKLNRTYEGDSWRTQV